MLSITRLQTPEKQKNIYVFSTILWLDRRDIQVGNVHESKPAAIFLLFEAEEVAQTYSSLQLVLATEKNRKSSYDEVVMFWTDREKQILV